MDFFLARCKWGYLLNVLSHIRRPYKWGGVTGAITILIGIKNQNTYVVLNFESAEGGFYMNPFVRINLLLHSVERLRKEHFIHICHAFILCWNYLAYIPHMTKPLWLPDCIRGWLQDDMTVTLCTHLYPRSFGKAQRSSPPRLRKSGMHFVQAFLFRDKICIDL